MYIRPVEYATATGQIRSKELCCIYGTDGRCEHMINPEAIARLQDAFTYMKNNHPGTMEALQAGTFAEELRRLALRHRQLPGTKATKAQHWSLPQKLKHAIMSQTKITQERFSNPFTVHPCSSSYWTAHDRDRVFGANHNAFAVRWTGGSYAMPEPDVHAAAKAVDWAIRSAKSTTESTLTLLLLPTFFAWDGVDTDDDAAYMQLVRRNHDVCFPICIFGRDIIQLEPPGCQPFASPISLKWKYRLLAVGNPAGFQEYFPYNVDGQRQRSSWYHTFEIAVRDALEEVPSHNRQPKVKFTDLDKLHMDEDATPTLARWARKAGKRFCKRPTDNTLATVLPRPLAYQTPARYSNTGDMRRLDSADDPLEYAQLVSAHSQAMQALRRSQPNPPPLAHNWEEFLYTDGSHVKGPDIEGPGTGAAVHVPGPSSHTLAVHCAWQGEGADNTCNTICRAELAGLHVAITQYGTTHTRADGTLHVATDSLGSMYGLAKMITRPQDQKEHRHRQVLEALANAVKDHPGTIHLWKVKSHTGIIGNELADNTAVQVARGELPDTQLPHIYDIPSNSRRQMYWPYKETAKERPSGEIVKVTIPLPDMQEALKT